MLKRFATFPILVTVLGTVAMVACCGGLAFSLYDLSQADRVLRQRHTEATQTIQFVYNYREQHGDWPSAAEISAAGYPLGAPNWEYTHDENTTVLALGGPYHMQLVYYFEPIADGEPSRDWILSIEGSKRSFRSDTPYAIKKGTTTE